MIVALVFAAALAGAAQPAARDGRQLFHQKCGMCHDAGGMGAGLLARRIQPALLEERSGLAAGYVFQYARRGLGNMPPIAAGEVSDAQLKAIAAYLAAGPHGAR